MSYGRDIIYLYDGTFDGFLTAVYDSYYRHEIPEAMEASDSFQQNLFCGCYTVQTDIEKAERVSKAIKNKISQKSLVYIYQAFLSDTKNKERICLEYIRTGFFYGKNVEYRLTITCVNIVMKSVRRIHYEAEQYLGFVRFSELKSGIYYSEINPKCNILPLISEHFLKRFSGTPWIIHDTGRNLCSVSNGKEYILTSANSAPTLSFSENEFMFRKLWKEFYDTTEIKQRHNERCRLSHMPKRFWRNMTEFQQ